MAILVKANFDPSFFYLIFIGNLFGSNDDTLIRIRKSDSISSVVALLLTPNLGPVKPEI